MIVPGNGEEARGLPDLALPPLERITHLHLVAWEAALRSLARDGDRLPADAVAVLQWMAAASPRTAARLCPRIMAQLPPAVQAQVRALAATQVAPVPPEGAQSGRDHPSSVGTGEAAARLGLSVQAVRAAAARGSLPGVKDKITGEWQFGLAEVGEYARAHGRSRSGDPPGAGERRAVAADGGTLAGQG